MAEVVQAGPRPGGGGWRQVWRRIRDRLPIYWRDIQERPAWLLMFTFGRWLVLRRIYHSLARLRGRSARPPSSALVAGPPAEHILERLRTEGLCPGLRLPRATVEQIRDFAETHTCYAGMDRSAAFLAREHLEAERRLDRKILVGTFWTMWRAARLSSMSHATHFSGRWRRAAWGPPPD